MLMANEHTNAPLGGKKPKNTTKTLKRLLQYLNKYWLYLAMSMLCILFVTLGTVFAIRLMGTAIDAHIAAFDFAGLLKVCSMLMVIYLATSLCMWLQGYLLLVVGQNVVATIRKELFDKLQKLPLKYFDTTTHGELMSRVTNDVENISMALNNSLSQVLQSGLTLVCTFAMMVYLSIPLTIASVVTIPVMLLATKAITTRSKKIYKEKQERLGNLNGYIEEIISGQKVVKVYCQEEETQNSFFQKNNALLNVGIRAEIFSGVIAPIMMALNNISYALIVAVGGMMIVAGLPMTLGTISNFIIYSKQFTRPLNELANQINAMMAAFAGAERVFEVLDEPEEALDEPEAISLNNVQGKVVFSDVDFAYEQGHPILKDVNLYAKPGQTIALVGPTGAGKTTIINLLTRFYDINRGTITIDGHNIMEIQRKSLRGSLGIVLQDTYLFTDTIRENIRYGRLNATDDEIIEAAALANAHEFIRRLPDGYDTVLSDGGGNLSQGQRQMLAIARAILANPSILILDEATSSVDTRTELKIQEAMQNLMKGRTNFVIAHRLSTIRDADLIAVINHGEIIERGDHTELMHQKGFYYNLYSNQFETEQRLEEAL